MQSSIHAVSRLWEVGLAVPSPAGTEASKEEVIAGELGEVDGNALAVADGQGG